jgi:ubiquinol-cytochrome c reductase cytochrome c1 subunit
VALDNVELDLSDKASLQRGAKIFMNYCLSCHSASYMRYNRMGKDLGLSDKQVKESLMFASDKVGDTMTVAMRPEDAKKWFGVVPPDLSVISRARGTDWLYTYLRSYYLDTDKPLGTNNLVFTDVGMPHVLWQEQGYLRKDSDNQLHALTGDQEMAFEYSMMIRDLVNFMAYIGEPSKIERLALGKWVLLYLVLFFFVAYPLKKAFWEDVH